LSTRKPPARVYVFDHRRKDRPLDLGLRTEDHRFAGQVQVVKVEADPRPRREALCLVDHLSPQQTDHLVERVVGILQGCVALANIDFAVLIGELDRRRRYARQRRLRRDPRTCAGSECSRSRMTID
jgi:hypothetical protein